MADTQQSKKSARAERRAYWQSHMAGWKQGGGSKQAYCREQGLNPASFYRWHRILLGGEADRAPFIALRLPVRAAKGYPIELRLANGRRLRIGGDADPLWVAQLVRALETAC
jgi:hypothetical protein